jgi:MFS family permease
VTAADRARRARATFYVLTALRWLPTGLLIPILVLYWTSKGLTLVQVGVVMAVQAAVILALELPTGGLADALGRRPVLAAAAAVGATSTALLLAADGFAGIAAAWALQGVFRALDSGPLEAWYVDAALAADPRRDLERDLSGASTVLYAAVATGSLATAGLGLLGPAVDPLATAVAAALVLDVVSLVAVLVLVREVRPAQGLRAAVAAARATPQVVRAAVRLAWARRPLRLLLAVELLWGAGLTFLELLWQPRTAVLVGPGEDAVVLGVMAAGGWVAGAVGAAGLPPLVRLAGGTARAAAALRVVQGLAVLGLGLAGGVVGVVTAYVAFYAVHGAANPAHSALLHRQVGAGERATVLSVNSLLSRAGGLPAALAVGVLADGFGLPAALAVGAVVTAAAAPLYLRSARLDRLAAPRGRADQRAG